MTDEARDAGDQSDEELTPIFHALRRRAADARFRRDPLAAPLPPSASSAAPANRMVLRVVSNPHPESKQQRYVSEVTPGVAEATLPRVPLALVVHGRAGSGGGGRHRAPRAIASHGVTQGHSRNVT
jgi:hypothetical protein